MKTTGSAGLTGDREPEQRAVGDDLGGAEPVDLGRATRQTGGDPVLLARILSLVAGELRSILGPLQEDAGRGDLEAVERAAHALRGSAGNIAANPIAAVAADLQRAAREGRAKDVPALIARLAREADRFHAFRARLPP
jgi:two-component system sensor histidine kinase/response regulator